MTVTSIDHISALRARPVSLRMRLTPHRVVGSDALPATGRWLGKAATALLLPIGLLAAWALAARYELVAPQILPAPAIVWATAIELVASGQLHSELLVSIARVAAGLSIGGFAGLAVGLGMGLSPTAEAYFAPTVRAIWLVPSLGWLPFFMLVFGIGEELKIVLIAKACFLPMMIKTFEGVRNVPSKYREIARMLGLGSLDTLGFVVLPAILPSVLDGFRLALSKGWQVLVLVEMIASAAGIGYLMTWGRKSFQLDVVLVTMFIIGATGWLLDRVALAVQQRATSWTCRSVG